MTDDIETMQAKINTLQAKIEQDEAQRLTVIREGTRRQVLETLTSKGASRPVARAIVSHLEANKVLTFTDGKPQMTVDFSRHDDLNAGLESWLTTSEAKELMPRKSPTPSGKPSFSPPVRVGEGNGPDGSLSFEDSVRNAEAMASHRLASRRHARR